MNGKSRVVSTRLSEQEEALVRGAALGSRVSMAELIRVAAVGAARRRMADLSTDTPFPGVSLAVRQGPRPDLTRPSFEEQGYYDRHKAGMEQAGRDEVALIETVNAELRGVFGYDKPASHLGVMLRPAVG